MVNYRLKSNLLEVVETQLIMDEPKFTKVTFERLVNLGFNVTESKEMIASVLKEEINYMMNEGLHYNEKRFAQKLSLLPKAIDGTEAKA